MAYKRKTDKNHFEITWALRSVGASVFSLHTMGKGCPDIIVGFRGFTYLMEIKTEKGTLTEPEERWINEWRGNEVAIVRTADEALEVIGAIDAD